jgi:uncharacterized protein YcbX
MPSLKRPMSPKKRFRSNIAIDGAPAWDEQSWIGRNVRVGEVDFKVTRPVTRCLQRMRIRRPAAAISRS